MRQVAWKKVARSGELVSRETTGTASRELWLDWADGHGADTELRLSRLAAWVLQAEREGLDCGLRLPGRRCHRARATPIAAPRWTCWRCGLNLRQRLTHLPRDTRDTLFHLVVIGWTIAPHLLHLPPGAA